MVRKGLIGLFVLVLSIQSASAAGGWERTFGLHGALFTGTAESDVVPSYAGGFTFSSNYVKVRYLNWVNHFAIDALVSGAEFGGEYGPYHGISGTYGTGVRLNLSREGLIPYLELGPLLNLIGIRISSQSSEYAQGQVSLNYGAFFATGFDWIAADRKQGGGWGISIGYYHLLPGLAYAAKSLGAKALKLEFRFVLGVPTKK